VLLDDAVRDEGVDGRGLVPEAAQGLAGGAQALPHGGAIQAAFGHHDIGSIEAHVGGPATAASERMGAQAYATGNSVAFAAPPDLHTAAHEAAHDLVQRVSTFNGGAPLEDDVTVVYVHRPR